MNIEIAMSVSGFLFLFILILYIGILPLLGYVMGDYDSDVMTQTLQKINKNPKKI